VVIDALGSPAAIPRAIARILAAVSPLCPEVRMAPGADRDHPVCGAASIFAKTSRDGALAEIAAAWGEVGSGYPSDPKTRDWLTRWAATGEPWPPFVRTRWGTIGDLERGRPQVDTIDPA
jgi:ribonuclease HII